MAQVTSYATTEAIRGCLGIDQHDCPDRVIIDSRLELELEVDLDGWLDTHTALYEAGILSSATADAKRVKNYILLYSQWFCAYEMASRFLLTPQIVSDGKNQMNRFSKIDLDRVKDLAAARMSKYKTLLDEDVNGATTSVPSLLAISVPDFDPVTNS